MDVVLLRQASTFISVFPFSFALPPGARLPPLLALGHELKREGLIKSPVSAAVTLGRASYVNIYYCPVLGRI
jgi:hypothetical protein